MRASHKYSEYHLHGNGMVTPSVLAVAAIAALSSGVTDAVMAHVLEDDRIWLHLDTLERIVTEGLADVHQISTSALMIIPSATYVSAAELRAAMAQVSATTAAFLGVRVFREARKLPWSLALGHPGRRGPPNRPAQRFGACSSSASRGSGSSKV
jgi:hypothetical protein